MLQCRYEFIYVDRRCSFECLIPLSDPFGVLRFPCRWRAFQFRIPAKNFAASCLPMKSHWNNTCPVLCLAEINADVANAAQGVMAYLVDLFEEVIQPPNTEMKMTLQ